jgi:hypothetical protein
MNAKTLTWIALSAALICGGCAPVDSAASKKDEKPDEVENVPVEKLDVIPTPAPSGPRFRIESAVENVRQRDLLTTNGFWTIFHGILGLGPSVKLVDPMTREKVNAVEYICRGRRLEGMRFLPTEWGLDVETTGPTGRGQGHQDQFIAEMGQWGMPPDQKFHVIGRDYTYMDFVRHTQMRASVTKNQELSWAIIIIGQYLGTDLTWTNGFGEKLRFEDLVRYEVDASITEAACGGTHRLFGLSWVYQLHLQNGGKTEGVWKEIGEKTAKYRDLAKQYQNGDGSFSTDFFAGPANVQDPQRRINTTGHTLEWLALALPDAELKEQWVQDAANALSLMILDLQGSGIEGGSLYHAVHGLLLYYARVYDRQTLGPRELFFPRSLVASLEQK